ncbi:hypothetical protein [Nocardia sp. NPDC004750]
MQIGRDVGDVGQVCRLVGLGGGQVGAVASDGAFDGFAEVVGSDLPRRPAKGWGCCCSGSDIE